MLPVILGKLLAPLWQRASAHRARALGFAQADKCINLALQGGGAHGAFTWGVLDRLIADGRLAIDGLSGTSAGAINAVMLADGLARSGGDAARQRLAEFWRAASLGGALPNGQRDVFERLVALLPQQGSPWLGSLSHCWSPYDFNPLNINPLRGAIEKLVDFAALRADTRRQLFISATSVHSGEPRVLARSELTADVVMASACLPFLFQAVQLDGIPHWDGGYSVNPPLLPFLEATATEDVLIVQINPLRRSEAATSAREIATRLTELTFNAPLLSELRALALAERLIEQGGLPRGTAPGQYRRLRLHRIVMDAPIALDARSRLNNGYDFLDRLRRLGEEAAQRFLDQHFDAIGRHGTMRLPSAAMPPLYDDRRPVAAAPG